MTDIKKWIKQRPGLYNAAKLLTSREYRVRKKLIRLSGSPQQHCDYLIGHSTMCGFGTVYPRTIKIDLSAPKLFNEKLLWLKYYRYNDDPLVARCYDKYLVREYVRSCGLEDILNRLYGAWKDVDDIPWDGLPEEYIMKVSSGCGSHVFKRAGKPFDRAAARNTLMESAAGTRELFTASGDLFATRNEQTYICERLMKPNEGKTSIEDYKFYCFHGQPRYLLYMWDRGPAHYSAAFYQIMDDGTLLPRPDLWQKPTDTEPPQPPCFPRMLEAARKLSAPFPFVRTDLYDDHGSVVFGELTFTPAGSYVLDTVFKPDMTVNTAALTELGELLDLE